MRDWARPARYRVISDLDGWPTIPGKLGRLEWHDNGHLVVCTDRPRLFARLWVLPGVQRWQVGDQEARALVPAERLPEVATLIPSSPEAPADLGGCPETLRAPRR